MVKNINNRIIIPCERITQVQDGVKALHAQATQFDLYLARIKQARKRKRAEEDEGSEYRPKVRAQPLHTVEYSSAQNQSPRLSTQGNSPRNYARLQNGAGPKVDRSATYSPKKALIEPSISSYSKQETVIVQDGFSQRGIHSTNSANFVNAIDEKAPSR